LVFTDQGLDTETVVTIDIKESKVSGQYRKHGYDGENIQQSPFTGEVLDSSTPKQKNILIRFPGEIPYDTPEKKIIWKLKGQSPSQKLCMTILGRNFETQPPTIKKYEIEFEAMPENFEGD
jgi:hypothetical protein